MYVIYNNKKTILISLIKNKNTAIKRYHNSFMWLFKNIINVSHAIFYRKNLKLNSSNITEGVHVKLSDFKC